MTRPLHELNFRELVRVLVSDAATEEVVNWARLERLTAVYGLSIVNHGLYDWPGVTCELAVELGTASHVGPPHRALVLVGSRHARRGRVFILDHEFEVTR
jgi:hypothetical protein